MQKVTFNENLTAQSQKNNTIVVYDIYGKVLFYDDSDGVSQHYKLITCGG